MWKKLATAALCAIAFGGAAQAEVSVVNMSKQFGLPYLPMIVIEAQQLIEKNAKSAGLGDVKTTWTQRVGPAAELDALLAGQATSSGRALPRWQRFGKRPPAPRKRCARLSPCSRCRLCW